MTRVVKSSNVFFQPILMVFRAVNNLCDYKHLKPETYKEYDQLKEKVEALEKAVQQITKTIKDNEQLKEKLEVIEKVVHALTRKVLNYEKELTDLKKKTNICNSTSYPKYELSKNVKEKESDPNKEK